MDAKTERVNRTIRNSFDPVCLFGCNGTGVKPRQLATRAFLRKHDDITASDIVSGEVIRDADRTGTAHDSL